MTTATATTLRPMQELFAEAWIEAARFYRWDEAFFGSCHRTLRACHETFGWSLPPGMDEA